MVRFVESELENLKNEVIEMWTLVYSQMSKACEAILTVNKELAQQVLMREKRVNILELKIDSDVEDIIALYNPVAIDLRFTLAMLKINTNLERIGDFAESMARFAANYPEAALNEELLNRLRLKDMMEEVKTMLQNGLEALKEENTELATSIFLQDSFVDEVNRDASRILSEFIEQNPSNARACIDLITIFRKLERTGDHINNMAEEIIFYVDAKVMKHRSKFEKQHDKNNA